MELQVGVKILLSGREGTFLILRRAEDIYPEVRNKWDIPGGRIDPGSPLLENLTREVLEETGLTLKDGSRLIAAQDIFSRDGKRHIVRLTYLGEAEGEPRLSGEHTEYRWVTRDESRSLDGLDGYVRVLLDSGTW